MDTERAMSTWGEFRGFVEPITDESVQQNAWLAARGKAAPFPTDPMVPDYQMNPQDIRSANAANSSYELYMNPNSRPTPMDYETSAFNVGTYGEPGRYKGFSLQNWGKPKSNLEGLRRVSNDPESVYRHELAHSYDRRLTPWSPKINGLGQFEKNNMTLNEKATYGEMLYSLLNPNGNKRIVSKDKKKQAEWEKSQRYVADREAPAVLAEDKFQYEQRPNGVQEQQAALRALLKSKQFLNSKDKITVADFNKIDTDQRWFL
jgi:hypothetical protein